MDLKDQVAIVTGASRGMGIEIAKILAGEGSRVALVGRDRERLGAVLDEIRAAGGEAAVFPADLRTWEPVEAMVNAVVEKLGAVDILVNSAFWGPPASLEDTTEAFWDQTLDTCLKAPLLCARAVAPYMKVKGRGKIVNIGSKAGKIGEDNRTAYCAAKWGLEGLTAALSVELSKYNIHVHLISPAATDTPWWEEVGASLTPQVVERMIPARVVAEAVRWVLLQPDQVHVPDILIDNYRNPFEGKGSPFET
jgi:3-oxoacyl-[acyl-carrier protein] reductase